MHSDEILIIFGPTPNQSSQKPIRSQAIDKSPKLASARRWWGLWRSLLGNFGYRCGAYWSFWPTALAGAPFFTGAGFSRVPETGCWWLRVFRKLQKTHQWSIIEGSLNSKLPTIWRVEKQMKSRWDEVKSEERRCNSAKVRRKKIHPRQMLEKSRNAVFFQWFVCRVSRKVGSLKRRVRSHVVRGEIKNCTPLWREAHFEVKMYKTHQHRTTFWSWDVEKLHAAVARSTFSSENVQNMSGSDHFLKLRCWKIARRCGEKHIFKWKCTKHVSFGPLFEVEMLKNCTPLWREAHFQVKMYKTLHSRSTFRSYNVEKLHAAVARSTFPTQNLKKLTVSDHFLKSRSWKIARRCGEKHISNSKCTKYLCFAAFFHVQMSQKCLAAFFQVQMSEN